MTGHETFYRTNVILSFIITIILFLIMIPFFSMIGAAIASAFGLVFQNIRALWLVNKYLGFTPIYFNQKYIG